MNKLVLAIAKDSNEGKDNDINFGDFKHAWLIDHTGTITGVKIKYQFDNYNSVDISTVFVIMMMMYHTRLARNIKCFYNNEIFHLDKNFKNEFINAITQYEHLHKNLSELDIFGN